MSTHPRGAYNLGIALVISLAKPFTASEKKDFIRSCQMRKLFMETKMFTMIMDCTDYDEEWMRKAITKKIDRMIDIEFKRKSMVWGRYGDKSIWD